ncbi:MAG TPA: hypothetical protein VG604_04130 [Candidatus Saccharimonadales bacterium]|nr:hypothetical protein [Candidatus Saccharimonadales bacterium]
MKLNPFRRGKKTLKADSFIGDWHDLQQFCRTRKTWPDAIKAGDALLEKALKSKGYKGKTTGERLVAAQHELTENETVWFAHKFASKIDDEDVRKLKKNDVLKALSGFREALRDLGALER